jgi:hypothetical protein
MKNNPRGFIALISIIIMSVMLLATTLSLAQFGIANRHFILDLENKRASEKLAEACVQVARIHIYNDFSYSVARPGISINVAGEECVIASVSGGNIEIQATRRNAITNLVVKVNSNGDFIEWRELPNL